MIAYDVTFKGAEYKEKLWSQARTMSGTYWQRVAPRYAILESLSPFTVIDLSREGTASQWSPEEIGRALKFLVQNGYVNRFEVEATEDGSIRGGAERASREAGEL